MPRKIPTSKIVTTTLRATISNSLKFNVQWTYHKRKVLQVGSHPFLWRSLASRSFRDAIALRYGWQPLHTSTTCACGTNFSVEHALLCPKGGFPTVRHRDLTANLMSEVCHNVCIEPSLQPITGEALAGTSVITKDGARLDVAASGFWGGRIEFALLQMGPALQQYYRLDQM